MAARSSGAGRAEDVDGALHPVEESDGGSVARSPHDEQMCGRPPDDLVDVLAKMVQEALEHDRRSARSANK